MQAVNQKHKNQMNEELFDMPETPIPPLVKARAELNRAIENHAEAEALVDDHGPEAAPLLVKALSEMRKARENVERLEREEIRK